MLKGRCLGKQAWLDLLCAGKGVERLREPLHRDKFVKVVVCCVQRVGEAQGSV